MTTNHAYDKGYEAGLLRAYEIAQANEIELYNKEAPQIPLFPTHILIHLEMDKAHVADPC